MVQQFQQILNQQQDYHLFYMFNIALPGAGPPARKSFGTYLEGPSAKNFLWNLF
jgi:hypothetical protein